MVSRLATPGLVSSSKTISRPESVTADLIFLTFTRGSSSSSTMPVGAEADLLIFAVGSARSAIRPTGGQDVRLGHPERRAEPSVEADRQVAGELQVLALVLPDRNPLRLVEQDVGRHQHGIGEQGHGHGVGPAARRTCP